MICALRRGMGKDCNADWILTDVTALINGDRLPLIPTLLLQYRITLGGYPA